MLFVYTYFDLCFALQSGRQSSVRGRVGRVTGIEAESGVSDIRCWNVTMTLEDGTRNTVFFKVD